MTSVLLSDSQNYYYSSYYTNYSFLKLSSLHLFSFIFSHGIGKAVVTLLLLVYYCCSLAYSKKKERKKNL